MACTGLAYGTVTVPEAGWTITISGLSFVPNRVMVGYTKEESQYFSYCGDENNPYIATYSDDAEIQKSAYDSITLGKTTKLSAKRGWIAYGQFYYVLWREE